HPILTPAAHTDGYSSQSIRCPPSLTGVSTDSSSPPTQPSPPSSTWASTQAPTAKRPASTIETALAAGATMHWQFHYPKRNSFYPPDYEDPGLGGAEASLVLLTRALAARGHRVEVFNCCYRPGAYAGVRWRMCWELSDAPTPDVAVAVRFDEALWPAASR